MLPSFDETGPLSTFRWRRPCSESWLFNLWICASASESCSLTSLPLGSDFGSVASSGAVSNAVSFVVSGVSDLGDFSKFGGAIGEVLSIVLEEVGAGVLKAPPGDEYVGRSSSVGA